MSIVLIKIVIFLNTEKVDWNGTGTKYSNQKRNIEIQRTVAFLAVVVFLAAGFLATFFLSAGLAVVAVFLAAVALASPAGRLAAGLA